MAIVYVFFFFFFLEEEAGLLLDGVPVNHNGDSVPVIIDGVYLPELEAGFGLANQKRISALSKEDVRMSVIESGPEQERFSEFLETLLVTSHNPYLKFLHQNKLFGSRIITGAT